MAGNRDDTVVSAVASVLGRLGVGQILRLRRAGAGGTVEVLARVDGALEVPAAVLGESGGGPHVLFGRHQVEELAGLLVAVIDDLELVTSSIVDGAGIERLLDGSGARTETTVDGLLDRWDQPLIEQVRRYLTQRFALSPSDFAPGLSNVIFVGLGRTPHAVWTLDDPSRIFISATIVHGTPGSEQLDLALHRASAGNGLVRLRHHWNKVLAEVVLPAPTFMGQHLDLAFSEIGRVSAELSDAIAAEFGGDVSFRLRYRPQLSDVIDPDDPAHRTEKHVTDEPEEENP
jgi:hypothetical protein